MTHHRCNRYKEQCHLAVPADISILADTRQWAIFVRDPSDWWRCSHSHHSQMSLRSPRLPSESARAAPACVATCRSHGDVSSAQPRCIGGGARLAARNGLVRRARRRWAVDVQWTRPPSPVCARPAGRSSAGVFMEWGFVARGR